MLSDLADPDRRFALTHVASNRRAAAHAIWAFDEALGQIVAATRDPFVGQMRLTWWHEAVSTLGQGGRRGQPILDALADERDVDPVTLARVVEGWEALLEPLPFGDDVLLAYARGRGGAVFSQMAALCGGATGGAAGEGWALVDFAKRCSDAATAARAWSLAAERLAVLPAGMARPLRSLTRLAKTDASVQGQAGRTRWRLLRATW